MAVHDYHQGLPGYDPEQIWFDGCAECEQRADTLAIHTLDSTNFRRAWLRADKFNRGGLPNVSKAEARLLNLLGQVQVMGRHAQVF